MKFVPDRFRSNPNVGHIIVVVIALRAIQLIKINRVHPKWILSINLYLFVSYLHQCRTVLRDFAQRSLAPCRNLVAMELRRFLHRRRQAMSEKKSNKILQEIKKNVKISYLCIIVESRILIARRYVDRRSEFY